MRDLVERVRQLDHFVLVARLSLIVLIVNVNREPVLLAFAAAATVYLFLRPALLRRPWPWLVMAAVVGAVQAMHWWLIDDHVVVTTYWILGIGLSRFADQQGRVLGQIGRLLVGLVFAFAFGWKLLSSQYSSTEFFRHQLLTDDRFALVAEHVAQTDTATIRANTEASELLRTDPEAIAQVTLDEGSMNEPVAGVFTYWGLFIEGVIAGAFLLPLRGRARLLRPAALFAFAFTTYAVIPVAGFGAMLMVLGLASQDGPRLRPAYVASFVALLAWGGIFPLLL